MIRPDFEILLNGQNDITERIKKNLISVSVSDSVGADSDTCQITLSDADQNLETPQYGFVSVGLGYKNNISKMGDFFISDCSVSSPPDVMTINGISAIYSDEMKKNYQRGWNGRTLGAIAEKIAAESGCEIVVSENFRSFFFDALNQDNENNHQFLLRIASSIGAIYKPSGRKLLILARDAKKSASGKTITPIKISLNNVNKWSYRRPKQSEFDSVGAWYLKEGKYLSVFASKNGQIITNEKPNGSVYTLHNYFDSREMAEAEAKTTLSRINKNSDELSLSMTGDNRIMSETPITITDGRDFLKKKWVACQATHSISRSSYTTSLNLKPDFS